MNNDLKYFYYISKTKVTMLLGQLQRNSFGIPHITPKVEVAGIGLEAEFKSRTEQNLANDTLTLIKEMRKKKLLKPLSSNPKLNTNDFWEDKGNWFNGLLVFWGRPNTVTYFLWKTHQDAIIFLIGSPLNILGDKVVGDGMFAPGTSGQFFSVIDFVNRLIEPSENVLAFDSVSYEETISQGQWYKENTEGALPLVALNEASSSLAWNKILDRTLEPGKQDSERAQTDSLSALPLGIFCLRHLTRLPYNKIDLTFKLLYETDLDRRKDLSDWFKELQNVPKEFIEKHNLERCRKVLVGSPIYTALT